MTFQDRVTLITGATGGVGPTVVRAFAATGTRLVLTARRQEALEKLAQEQGLAPEQTLLYAADLAEMERV